MRCKTCNRPLQRGRVWRIVWDKVIEPLCQTCRGWVHTGKVYDVR